MALTRQVKLAYGVGHVFNDLCASMWFTYLLVYLQYVLQLDRGLSGFLLLMGQVADAVSTPLIGLQSDRGCSFCTYGRRKSWHAIGTVCVLVSFPFIFIVCGLCFATLGFGYILLLGFMICLFQFGWAATQVSHLALIPDLTNLEAERDELNIIRYILDVCSDVLVYLVAWITFAEDTTTANKFVDPGDASNFKTITITVLVVGTFFSVLFHLFTPERASTRTQAEAYQEVAASETQAETSPTTSTPQQEEQPVNSYTAHVRMMWKDWLAEPQFYQITLLYACSRLVANLANIYMPIYLQETIHARQELIATVPLVMSLSGVGASFLLRSLRKCIGKKASVVVGIVIGLVAATVSALPWIPEFGMYIVAILWGTSSSILVIISLAFTADLIGRSTESSAFVYGSMSFADKIINGVAVLIIQELTRVWCNGTNCSDYFRHVMSLGIFVPLMTAFIAICLINRQRLGRTQKLLQAERETGEASGSSLSSNSSELLLSTGTNLGYGAITKA
ncbi:major facilitator superfamily domain-containing protein 12-like [Homarus americanus]|uniref:major facilitator superfamily domain-containing protein 12-like n=1 Tax=Homarus americanus TaxID=6706 RepID=UPI001C48D3DD|nr:major facilitator superfamily domain-containing protein 12-like [Homarus americanus]XP_042220072.1 major facilitator superfamily domain-containing protein 12-like [Homarus americanus]XP_042220073.1 major facilitator superfamily domain-containing protein 12-like [Homarus americanus]XP_042220075.1 major facilitator superfamily domain-containing protein 12-like [Homarus americanus]